MAPELLDPSFVLAYGLSLLKLDSKRSNSAKRIEKFKAHYGADPLVMASQWFDLSHGTLTSKEVRRGLKMFLVAHYFLWNYPRNATQLGDKFDMCPEYAQGKHLWDWIAHLASLESKVIYWPASLNCPTTEKVAISVDGVDKKTWERKHQTEFLPFDRKNYTQKHAHGGLKYQIVLAAQRMQCVHIYGPVPGGMGDKEMLSRSGVLAMLPKGKLAVCDRGYIKNDFKEKVAWPNHHDTKQANNMKSRIRLRHESFNGKMSFYASMNQTWRHSDDKHGLAFRAVAVTVQYGLDCGTLVLFEP